VHEKSVTTYPFQVFKLKKRKNEIYSLIHTHTLLIETVFLYFSLYINIYVYTVKLILVKKLKLINNKVIIIYGTCMEFISLGLAVPVQRFVYLCVADAFVYLF